MSDFGNSDEKSVMIIGIGYVLLESSGNLSEVLEISYRIEAKCKCKCVDVKQDLQNARQHFPDLICHF